MQHLHRYEYAYDMLGLVRERHGFCLGTVAFASERGWDLSRVGQSYPVPELNWSDREIWEKLKVVEADGEFCQERCWELD